MISKRRALVAQSLPEWEQMFMSYKALNKELKLISRHSNGKKRSRSNYEGNLQTQDMGFTLLLDRELDKINTFYIDKEEDYIIRFRELQIKADHLLDKFQELQIKAEHLLDNEEMWWKVQWEVLDFYSEMVMLLRYSCINLTRLIKIVKKHKRRTGVANVYSSYMQMAMQQPFFSTDLLYKLIKGCEAILTRFSPPNN